MVKLFIENKLTKIKEAEECIPKKKYRRLRDKEMWNIRAYNLPVAMTSVNLQPQYTKTPIQLAMSSWDTIFRKEFQFILFIAMLKVIYTTVLL